MMAKNCWCNLKFHLPGEQKRHDKILRDTMRILAKDKKIKEK